MTDSKLQRWELEDSDMQRALKKQKDIDNFGICFMVVLILVIVYIL